MSDNCVNILIVIADQLSRQAIGAYGSSLGVTPNIDRLAARGVRFDACYTPSPLCQPARAAFWTGRFPHETGIRSNGWKDSVPTLAADVPALGEMFSAAGYEAVHFGKTHDAGALRGFRIEPMAEQSVPAVEPWPVNADTFQDCDTTERVIEFLQTTRPAPFLAVADLNNPHNICQYVGEFAGPHADPPISTPLPDLPENFSVERFADLPLPVQFVCCSHNRQAQAAGWSEENFRHYLAAYAHYVSRVDAEIGRMLDALDASPAGRNTLVVLFSDHGDSMAGHGLVTKQVTLYDETTRVPLIFAGPGVGGTGGRSVEGLCSLLDLVPTLAGVGEVDAPAGLWGRSLLPWIRAERESSPHEYVVSEWFTEWGITVEPGRMLRSARWKYIRYIEADGEELYDLMADPGERSSLSKDPAFRDVIETHRRLLSEHLSATSDSFNALSLKADPRWRSHELGYHVHRGPAAPMVA